MWILGLKGLIPASDSSVFTGTRFLFETCYSVGLYTVGYELHWSEFNPLTFFRKEKSLAKAIHIG